MQFKLIITGLLCMICSNVLHADYDAADLQKLFTDKKQRAQIDAVRSGNIAGIESAAQQTNTVNLSGYMTRSDGKSVVWLNNKNTLDGSKVGEVKVHRPSIGKNKKVLFTVNEKNIQLKPGQVWSDDAGKITDSN